MDPYSLPHHHGSSLSKLNQKLLGYQGLATGQLEACHRPHLAPPAQEECMEKGQEANSSSTLHWNSQAGLLALQPMHILGCYCGPSLSSLPSLSGNRAWIWHNLSCLLLPAFLPTAPTIAWSTPARKVSIQSPCWPMLASAIHPILGQHGGCG